VEFTVENGKSFPIGTENASTSSSSSNGFENTGPFFSPAKSPAPASSPKRVIIPENSFSHVVNDHTYCKTLSGVRHSGPLFDQSE
jgi:hypothetical protein